MYLVHPTRACKFESEPAPREVVRESRYRAKSVVMSRRVTELGATGNFDGRASSSV